MDVSGTPKAKNESPAVGCIALIITAIIFGFGYRSCSRMEEARDREREQAAHELELDDQRQASAHGISVDEWRQARWASNTAYAECKVAAEQRAKHDYKSDFIPKMNWELQGKKIMLVGHDLQMQNGFGVWSYVTYNCEWDLDRKAVVSLDIIE